MLHTIVLFPSKDDSIEHLLLIKTYQKHIKHIYSVLETNMANSCWNTRCGTPPTEWTDNYAFVDKEQHKYKQPLS